MPTNNTGAGFCLGESPQLYMACRKPSIQQDTVLFRLDHRLNRSACECQLALKSRDLRAHACVAASAGALADADRPFNDCDAALEVALLVLRRATLQRQSSFDVADKP